MKILQMFGWSLKDITKNLDMVAYQGFTHIQTSPLQGTKDSGLEWWKLYQPIDLTIGNFIGTKTDLIDLCNAAKHRGISIIVDVVLRHVATDEADCNIPHHNVDSELLPYIINRPRLYDESDRHQVTEYSCGMPMLDYENPGYQKIASRYLNELVECGVDMFRLDMAKHYKLPSEYGTFLTKVMGKYKWIGEVLFEENQSIIYAYSELCYVFSMNSIEDKSRMIHAVECHDTYLNDDGVGFTRRLTSDHIIHEYEYMANYSRNIMLYTRPYCNAWMSESIRNSNKKYK